MQRFATYLEHLTADAFPLLIWSYDAVLMDEARWAQRFNILWSLCCPKDETRNTNTFWDTSYLLCCCYIHTKHGCIMLKRYCHGQVTNCDVKLFLNCISLNLQMAKNQNWVQVRHWWCLLFQTYAPPIWCCKLCMHRKMNIPLDPLESTAGHINNASCRSGYSTNQTFPNTFKEACCTLLLGSCKITHH